MPYFVYFVEAAYDVGGFVGRYDDECELGSGHGIARNEEHTWFENGPMLFTVRT